MSSLSIITPLSPLCCWPLLRFTCQAALLLTFQWRTAALPRVLVFTAVERSALIRPTSPFHDLPGKTFNCPDCKSVSWHEPCAPWHAHRPASSTPSSDVARATLLDRRSSRVSYRSPPGVSVPWCSKHNIGTEGRGGHVLPSVPIAR